MGGSQTRSLSALGEGPRAPNTGWEVVTAHTSCWTGPAPPGRGARPRPGSGSPVALPLAWPRWWPRAGRGGRGRSRPFSGRAGLRRDRGGGGGSVSDLLPPRVRRPPVPIAPRGCPAAGPLAPRMAGPPTERRRGSGDQGAADSRETEAPAPGPARGGQRAGRRSQRRVPWERPEGAAGKGAGLPGLAAGGEGGRAPQAVTPPARPLSPPGGDLPPGAEAGRLCDPAPTPRAGGQRRVPHSMTERPSDPHCPARAAPHRTPLPPSLLA